MSYRHYNPNPCGRNVGDCTVRALAKALDQSWERTYIGLCVQGWLCGDMPSANSTWGEYLRCKGFQRNIAPYDCTVAEFAQEHPYGVYILALSSHVVALIDGDWYDAWPSDNEIVLYFWEKEFDK